MKLQSLLSPTRAPSERTPGEVERSSAMLLPVRIVDAQIFRRTVSHIAILLFLPLLAVANTEVQIVLDASGSMAKVVKSESQMDSARQALREALDEISPDTFVGLRAYGHRIDQSDRGKSCKDSELLVSLEKQAKTQIVDAASSLKPLGYTPLAYSLEQAAKDFSVQREAQKVVILLSDGKETCDGDPVKVMEDLWKNGIEIRVMTVGFNVDAETKGQLQQIAQVSGGQYFDAQGAEQLGEALKEAAKAAEKPLEKEKTTYGNAVRGGDSYETAVPIQLGEELRLDHHQLAKDFDYFYVDLKRGEALQVETRTLEKGISFNERKGQFYETSRSGARSMVSLHKPNRSRVLKVAVFGASEVRKGVYWPTEDEKVFVLVGGANMHKDHSTFILNKIEARVDLGGQEDASDSFHEPTPVAPGNYEENFIGGPDKIDYYSVEMKTGQELKVTAFPTVDESKRILEISFYNDLKELLGNRFRAKNQGAGVRGTVKAEEDGSIIFKISHYHRSGDRPESYRLKVEVTEVKTIEE